ncbi:MAG: DUF4317 family protein [Lachnospiraceae bacterium]|nr:DUF4317 family protein [Lachnospiraceae bacterium]
MEKSDIKEIRKQVKARDPIIDWIYGLYVSSENEVVCESVDKWRDLEEAAQFRYQNLFAKTLSPRIGRDAFPVKLASQSGDLLFLREEGKQKEDFESFRDALLENYVHTDPYYATVARIIYDVPTKAKDKATLEDSDYVYEAVLVSICPAKLSQAALGLQNDMITELDRRWIIGNPKSGFLYPAFSDRTEDRNELLIHSINPDAEDYLKAWFDIAEEGQPVGMKEQKDLFADLLGQLGVSVEDAALMQEAVVEKAAEEDTGDTMTAPELKRLANHVGINVDNFDETYEDVVGNIPLAKEALCEKYVTVTTDAATVRLPTEKAQLIETRVIDGREYILIPADGAIEVNGAPVSARSILEENIGEAEEKEETTAPTEEPSESEKAPEMTIEGPFMDEEGGSGSTAIDDLPPWTDGAE